MVDHHVLVKSTTNTKDSLHNLHLLACDDHLAVRDAIPDVLVGVVEEDLLDGVNRPRDFEVSHRELHALLVEGRLNPGAHVDQHHTPIVLGARFLQHNHTIITKVLMFDELNHDFVKSVPLLDTESFVRYDVFDQDLPDASWIYLDTSVKDIGQAIRRRRLARTRHG